jgi:hypothetical protein
MITFLGGKKSSKLTICSVCDFTGDVVSRDVPRGWRLNDGLTDHGHVHTDADVLASL